MSFWLKFAITEAIQLGETFVAASSKLTDAQKAALESFITAGQNVLAAFMQPTPPKA